MIDLHTHSTFSDGTDTPAALVAQARALGLEAVALTDHDTVEGIPELLRAGREHGLTVVPGVELSVDAQVAPGGHLHMLGLLIDPESRELRTTLAGLAAERERRGERIVEKLQGLGIEVTVSELRAEAGAGAIGRPHVARLLMRKGYAASIQDAFDRYLGRGKPAYADKKKLGEEAAIGLIHRAGGLAILAHAYLMQYPDYAAAEAKILALMELGLDGFEVYYPGMPEAYTRGLLALARAHGLAVSGGSDYHGANKPDVRLGQGDGSLHIPEEVLDKLRARKRGIFGLV